jgi:WhiB family redox-sensing transcriptional regulator
VDWHESAICQGTDPDLFFPVGNASSGPTLIQIAEAKAVCHRCPVIDQCLSWALDADPVEGILGRHHRSGTAGHEAAQCGTRRPGPRRTPRRNRARTETPYEPADSVIGASLLATTSVRHGCVTPSLANRS